MLDAKFVTDTQTHGGQPLVLYWIASPLLGLIF